jgi:hypothetical protein
VKTPPAPPYLLPPEDAVTADAWRMSDGSPVPERLEHWDPFTDIDLVRIVNVNVDAVRAACQLGVDSALAVSASWVSTRTRLGDEGSPVEIGTLDGRVRLPVGVRVPGVNAGGRLDIRTRLVLRSRGTDPSPISPKRPGAVLWTQDVRLELEGAAARFPVSPADFRAIARLPDTGAWALEWDPEALEAPVLGAVRLLVNVAEESLVAALRSGSADVRSTMVRSFLTYDVARSLVHGALQNERFVDGPETFDDGSVGRMLFELLASCWPGIPVKALASRRLDDPARLDAELQSFLRVLP